MAESIDSGSVKLALMDRVCSELIEAEMVLHADAKVWRMFYRIVRRMLLPHFGVLVR